MDNSPCDVGFDWVIMTNATATKEPVVHLFDCPFLTRLYKAFTTIQSTKQSKTTINFDEDLPVFVKF